MALKVWEEQKVELEDVYLRLVDEGDEIMLIACDKLGQRYPSSNLLSIRHTGKIERKCGIYKNLGFSLDEDGRIKLYGEE